MPEVYVGLGSNVEPERHLVEAVAALRERFGELSCSRVYQSPSFGFSGADFLNMVAAFASPFTPAEIESVLSAVEHSGGRSQGAARSGSRTLDLDLLLYGARVDAAQRLPRGDVLEYPFVLAPLFELAPRLVHPVTGEVIGEAWRAMAGGGPRLACRGGIEDLR